MKKKLTVNIENSICYKQDLTISGHIITSVPKSEIKILNTIKFE